jgi:hypothetical protein
LRPDLKQVKAMIVEKPKPRPVVNQRTIFNQWKASRLVCPIGALETLHFDQW